MILPEAVIIHCAKHVPKKCATCPLVGECVAPVNGWEYNGWLESMASKIQKLEGTSK